LAGFSPWLVTGRYSTTSEEPPHQISTATGASPDQLLALLQVLDCAIDVVCD